MAVPPRGRESQGGGKGWRIVGSERLGSARSTWRTRMQPLDDRVLMHTAQCFDVPPSGDTTTSRNAEGIKLTPETLSVEITYRAPGPIVLNNLVAGALYEAIHKILGKSLHRLIPLPRNGRHPGTKKYSETSSPSSRFPKNNPSRGLLVTIVDRVLVGYA